MAQPEKRRSQIALKEYKPGTAFTGVIGRTTGSRSIRPLSPLRKAPERGRG
jgi:hypothetical protein